MNDRLAAALSDRYTIEREIGAGGMATVYLAHDLKHDRKVAVKVLRPELAAVIGAERFLAEIKTTANLQHPHILPLHDSGSADGFLFYVMPFIDGVSLRDRIIREHQLPVDDAVRIAKEVASALDYAHRHGVIHRDIKPENILLHDGSALVADFGIALAVSTAGTRLTETGMSLGTPHYMSPEQAMGEREITARSDVYALGCITYEMLVGEPPFTGPTAQAIIARVMTEEPRLLTMQRKSILPQVEGAVLHALEKLPADRLATAAQFAEALTSSSAAASHTSHARATALQPAPRARIVPIGAFAAGLLALAVASYYFGTTRAGASRVGYDVGLPDSAPVGFVRQNTLGMRSIAVARNGEFAVYVADRGANTELWYRSLRGFDAHPIPGTQGAVGPFLSPDGAWVAFFVGGSLRKVPVGGGAVATLADVELAKGGIWLSTNRLLVSEKSNLKYIDLSTGAMTRAARACDFPFVDERRDLALCSNGGTFWTVSVHDSSGSVRFPVPAASPDTSVRSPKLFGTDARIVDGQYLLFTSIEGALQAARFDPVTLRVGRVVTMLDGVRRNAYSGMGEFAVTAAGDLVYAPGDNAEVGRMVRTRDGVTFDTLPIKPVAAQRWDLSPDGRTLALVQQTVAGQELWIYDVGSGRGTKWQTSWYMGELRWDPTSRRIAFALRSSPLDSGVTLLGSPNSLQPPDTVARSDLAVSDFPAADLIIAADDANLDLQFIHLQTHPVRIDTLVMPGTQYFGTLSPDHRWLAFMDGERDIMLAPYPWTGMRYKVGEGKEPAWDRDGRLVYQTTNLWWYTVRLTTGNPPFEAPMRWFTDPQFLNTYYRSHVHAPDGSEIYLRGSSHSTGSYLRVIPGWVKQMKRAVDAAGQ